MIVHTGVPQGSNLSPSLINLYLVRISRSTEVIKQICYADDITVWASGVKITELEHKVNKYQTALSRFLQVNLISAPKSSEKKRV